MSTRISKHVERPAPVSLTIMGEVVTAYEGETLATALLAAGVLTMSHDRSGRPKSPFCNMGVCFDCLVRVEDVQAGTPPQVVRSCMTAVRAGLRVSAADR